MTSQPHVVAFYADLFYKSELSPPYWIPPKDLDVEAIILGGDIHYLPDDLHAMLVAIRQTQRDATRIVVVPGNGEYIDQELEQSRQQYRVAVESVDGAVFLDNEVVLLPSGLRVIGSTLWSLVAEENIEAYSARLADYGLKGVDNIRLGDRFLTLQDTNELHLRARSFIQEELEKLSAAEREETIVCTHFWPTLRPWPPRVAQDGPNGGPADGAGAEDAEWSWREMTGSDMDALIEECGPKLWLCGHDHTTKNVVIGNTRVSSNPRAGGGPGNINPDFDESHVVVLASV